VRFRIRPVETTFYDLFTESAQHLVTGADLLAQVLDMEVPNGDLAERMREAEHQADETTHRIIKRVNSTFITPFDREDIYNLASGLDDVMDHMDEAVDSIVLYGVTDFPEAFAGQVAVLQRAAQLTAEAMPRLRTMKDLEEFWIEINRLENEGDRIQRDAVASLFADGIDPMVVIRWKDIFDCLESCVDACEHVAHILEGIQLRRG